MPTREPLVPASALASGEKLRRHFRDSRASALGLISAYVGSAVLLSMQNPQPSVRIEIIHFAKNGIIELRYPTSTTRFWRIVATLANHYLELDMVKAVLQEHHTTAVEWSNAKKVLVRLASSRKRARITIEEAQHVADLVSMLCIHMRDPGNPWKWSRTLLRTWALIVRYQFNPLFAVSPCKKSKAPDPAMRCYEGIRKKIGDHPAWLTLQEVHDFWLETRNYRGENERVLDLERRLHALSRMYHLALETTVID